MKRKRIVNRLLNSEKKYHFQDPWGGANKEFVLLENAVYSAQTAANVSKLAISIFDKDGVVKIINPNI